MYDSVDSVDVLHVDDEPGFAEMTAAFLEREEGRFNVVTATSASDGLAALASEEIDCVVSDYDMSELDGLEFLDAVREDHEDLPFILFTGKGSEEIASEAISKGVTDYLQKERSTEQYTILANRILNVVETTMGRGRRRQQLEAIQTAREGISILDEDGAFIFVNDAYADIYGYDPDEMIGENWELIYPPDETEFARETIIPTVEADGYWHGETIGLRANGTTFVEDHIVSSTDRGEFVCTVRDVTERKARSAELRELNQFREAIIQSANVWINVLDEDGNIIVWNEAAEEISGYSAAEVLGHDRVWGCLYPDDAYRSEILTHVGDILQGTKAVEGFETTIQTKDGEDRIISWHSHILADDSGEPKGSVAVGRDVTEQNETQQRLRTLIENLPGIVYRSRAGPEWLFEVAQGECEALTGYTAAELCGDVTWAEAVIHPEDSEQTIEAIDDAVEDGEPFEVTYRIVTRDGRIRWMWERGREVGEGMLEGFITDITERKAHEQDLAEANERLELALEASSLGVYDWAVREEEISFDDRVPEILGFSSDEFDQRLSSWNERAHPDDRSQVRADLDELFREETEFSRSEYRMRAKSGDWKWIQSLGKVAEWTPRGEPERVIGVHQDITERKLRERELERQNDRLEEFASIVSHDLRNPLTVAEGRLELARADHENEHLEDVAQALERMRALIEDLLARSRTRERVIDTESVDLAALGERCWWNVETGEATLVVETDRSVLAERSQLQQLLENLMRNAIEHGGDDVVVVLDDLENEDGFFVEDDGPGIPEGERERVLEHGYSTTERGTGFGLSIVSEVADAHGWDVGITEGERGGARLEIAGVDFVQ